MTAAADPILQRLDTANKIAAMFLRACDCTNPGCELRQAATYVQSLAARNAELERGYRSAVVAAYKLGVDSAAKVCDLLGAMGEGGDGATYSIAAERIREHGKRVLE